MSFRGEISSRFALWFPKYVQLDFGGPTLPLGILKNRDQREIQEVGRGS